MGFWVLLDLSYNGYWDFGFGVSKAIMQGCKARMGP